MICLHLQRSGTWKPWYSLWHSMEVKVALWRSGIGRVLVPLNLGLEKTPENIVDRQENKLSGPCRNTAIPRGGGRLLGDWSLWCFHFHVSVWELGRGNGPSGWTPFRPLPQLPPVIQVATPGNNLLSPSRLRVLTTASRQHIGSYWTGALVQDLNKRKLT